MLMRTIYPTECGDRGTEALQPRLLVLYLDDKTDGTDELADTERLQHGLGYPGFFKGKNGFLT